MLHRITVSYRAYLAANLKSSYNNSLESIKEGKNYLDYIKSSLVLTPKQKEIQHSFYLFGMVSYLEGFISDLLYNNLTCFPGNLEDKSVKLDVFGEYGSALRIVKHSAEKLTNEYSYKNFRDIIEILSKQYDIKPKIQDDIVDAVNEIKCTRDIYTHNAGKANETYERKAGKQARNRSGTKLQLSDKYIEKSTENVEEIIGQIYTNINPKFKEYDRVKAFKEMWDYTWLSHNHPFETLWTIEKDILSKGQMLVRPVKEHGIGWSSSEQALYNFFLSIYTGNQFDFVYALKRWPAETDEGQVMLAWLDSPFYF